MAIEGKTTRAEFKDMPSDEREWRLFSGVQETQSDIKRLDKRFDSLDSRYIRKPGLNYRTFITIGTALGCIIAGILKAVGVL